MKKKISVSLDQDTVKMVDEKTRDSIFRNRSHFIEHSIKAMLGDKQ